MSECMIEDCLALFTPLRQRIICKRYGLRGEVARGLQQIADEEHITKGAVQHHMSKTQDRCRAVFGKDNPFARLVEPMQMRGPKPKKRTAYDLGVVRPYVAVEEDGEFNERKIALVETEDSEIEERKRVLREDYEAGIEAEVSVRREDGVQVRCVLRKPQRRYVRLRQRLRREKGQTKVSEVKCRQYGSSWVKATCHGLDLINYPGTLLLIVADDKAKAEHIARDYCYASIESIDERLRPTLSKFVSRATGQCFELGNGSRCIIGTANRAAQLARSWTAHFGLFTEVATWCLSMGSSQKADQALLAVMQCFPDPTIAPMVCIDVEATAYGQGGLFADTYKKGKKEGKDSDGWTSNFSPWQELEKYAVMDEKAGWSTEKEGLVERYRKFQDKEVSKALELDEFERNYITECDDMTWANLLWRRLYGLPKCQGDPYQFQQEYPSNDVEAFQFSGAPVFSPHSISHFEKEAKNKKFWPVEILVKSPTIFEIAQVESSKSDYHMFSPPVNGHHYFIGADVALGSASMYGDEGGTTKRSQNDKSVGSVWEQETGEQVLEFAGWPDPEEFGDVLYRLAVVYGRAVVNIERNTYGSETIKRIYHQLQYENLYMYFNDNLGTSGYHSAIVGMSVNLATRTMILDKFRVAVKTKIAKPRSLELLTEMAEVQRNEITGRMDHPRQGSDDRIFGAAHAWWAMTENNIRLSGDSRAVQEEVEMNPLGLPASWSPGQGFGRRVESDYDPILNPWGR